MNSRACRALPYAGVLIAALASQACGDGDETAPLVKPSVVLIDRTNQPLTIGELQSLGGTYGANCDGRAQGTPWNLKIAGPDVATPLSILAGDNDCALVLTTVIATGGTYSATPPIMIGQNYMASSVAAFTTNGGLVAFYANARFTLGAGDPPTLTVEFAFSDDPNLDNTPTPVEPAQSFAITGTGLPVTSPAYTIDVDSLGFETVAGVTTVVGTATLSVGAPDDTYVVSTADLDENSTFADVDAAYKAVTTPVTVTTPISGATLTTAIGASDPDASQASIIIAAVDDTTGITTYQVLTLTFPASCTPGPDQISVGGVCSPCGENLVPNAGHTACVECVYPQGEYPDNSGECEFL
jgi:hypothetical protein